MKERLIRKITNELYIILRQPKDFKISELAEYIYNNLEEYCDTYEEGYAELEKKFFNKFRYIKIK